MWIASKIGFFSIVAHREDSKKVLIRARVLGDLENLRPYIKGAGKIIETPAADYRFRLIVTKCQASAALLRLALEIDYPNFKGAIFMTPDQRPKLTAYHGLWENLLQVQEGRPRGFSWSGSDGVQEDAPDEFRSSYMAEFIEDPNEHDHRRRLHDEARDIRDANGTF